MTFPRFTVLGPLTQLELEALLSLHAACLQLRQEYEAAINTTMGHYRAGHIAEGHAQGKAFTHHREVLHKLAAAADRYEREMGMLAWQHAGAAVRLGTRVLARLVQGQKPLSVDEVTELCDEPTLGELRATLALPVDALLTPRDSLTREHLDKERQQLLQAVDGILHDAARLDDRHEPLPDDVVADFRLTQVSPPHMDPLYEGTLERLFSYAEGLPFEIAFYLEDGTDR